MNSEIMRLSDIPNARRCVCHVWRYQISHSLMQLRVTEPMSRRDFWLAFEDVQYFEGPMIWTGAVFRVESPEESLRFLREKSPRWVELPADLPEHALLGRFRLYVVEMPDVLVRIVAGTNSVSKTSAWLGETPVSRSGVPPVKR
jgi:hypothetical protein